LSSKKIDIFKACLKVSTCYG